VGRARTERDAVGLRRELRGDLDVIVLKALKKEPERRYASVERFAADVRRHLAGKPVEAVPDSRRYRAGKFVRRHRVGVAAAALVAAAIVAGVAGTLLEARAARAERERAVRRFNDVQGLARAVMFELNDAIEPLPGSTAARELLVRRALWYLDKLAAENADESSLQRELAQAYLRIGDVQGNPSRNNLGHTAASLESYRKALAILERLLKSMPADAGVRGDLATAHRAVGTMISVTGDPKGALPHLRQTVAIRQRLADERPYDWSRQVDLATGYQALGDVLVTLEDWPGVLEMRQKALPPIREAFAHAPGNRSLGRTLAMAYKRLGAIETKLKHYPDGLDAYRQALAIDEARLAAAPSNVEARMDVSLTVSDIGLILWQTGDRKAALEQYGRARAIRADLVKSDPNDERSGRALAQTVWRIASIRRELGEKQAALDTYREAQSLFERVLSRDPANTGTQFDFVGFLQAAGEAHGAFARDPADRCAAERPFYERAVRLYEELRGRRPLTPTSVSSLAHLEAALAACAPARR
jgi:eukaryotic-like serine/threonine-protein kinase